MMHIPRSPFTVVAVLVACLLLVSCGGSQVDDSSSESVTGSSSSGATSAGSPGNADDLMRSSTLRDQKNEVLVAQLLDTARGYRDRGDLQKAWDSVLRAVEVDATNAEARAMYNEIGRLLGYTQETTENIKEVLADRDD